MKIKNILIFNPFGIGDVLCSTPLIRNLKESLPDVSITYICNRRVYPLLKENIFLDKVMVFEKDEWRQIARKSKLEFLKRFFSFRSEVKRGKFDVLFDLSMNAQYGFFFKTTGIKKRIGFNFKKRGRFLTDKIDIKQGYADKHVARYYLSLLDFLGVKYKEYGFDLFLSEESAGRAKLLFKELNFSEKYLVIGVCPGSGDSWQKTAYFKRWPKDNFAVLCDELARKLKAKIILFGSSAEAGVCNYVYEKMALKPVNLCAKLSLEEFCALFSLCNIIITNDGGPFHAAQALGKKAVVFFGPVDERVYGVYPDGKNCLVFKKDIACRPCYAKFKFRGCEFDKKCLRLISPEEVFSAINSKLL